MRGAEAFSSVGEPDVSRVSLNSHNEAVKIIFEDEDGVDREGTKEDGGLGIGMAMRMEEMRIFAHIFANIANMRIRNYWRRPQGHP